MESLLDYFGNKYFLLEHANLDSLEYFEMLLNC